MYRLSPAAARGRRARAGLAAPRTATGAGRRAGRSRASAAGGGWCAAETHAVRAAVPFFFRVCDTIIVTWPSERAHDRRYTILDTRERLSVTRVAHMHFVSYYRISHTVCATALAHHVCAKAASSMLSGGMRGVGAA